MAYGFVIAGNTTPDAVLINLSIIRLALFELLFVRVASLSKSSLSVAALIGCYTNHIHT